MSELHNVRHESRTTFCQEHRGPHPHDYDDQHVRKRERVYCLRSCTRREERVFMCRVQEGSVR